MKGLLLPIFVEVSFCIGCLTRLECLTFLECLTSLEWCGGIMS